MVTCGFGGRNKRGGEVMDEGENSGGHGGRGVNGGSGGHCDG